MNTFYGVLKTLLNDFSTRLDPLFPKPFGVKAYATEPLSWTGRGVGIYPASPLGYVLEETDTATIAWIAVDIDCGHMSMTAAIPYLDVLRTFIRNNYSDITVSKAFIDSELGQKNDQAIVSALLEVTLDYASDRVGVSSSAPKFF